MDKAMFLKNVHLLYECLMQNHISEVVALSPDLVGIKMYEQPIVGFADAHDNRWLEMKNDYAVGEHFILPNSWLEGANTVVSFFFPMTEHVRESNKSDMEFPSKAWMNARIDGQNFINAFSHGLEEEIIKSGGQAVAPSISKDFATGVLRRDNSINQFTSNWSERHVAYICELGTFALSKGFITEKGIAGRFTSIITTLKIEPSVQRSLGIYENCIECGKCVKNCPVGAISVEKGKNQQICSDFLNEILAKNKPYYGCGKCQVGVPCEHQNPAKLVKRA